MWDQLYQGQVWLHAFVLGVTFKHKPDPHASQQGSGETNADKTNHYTPMPGKVIWKLGEAPLRTDILVEAKEGQEGRARKGAL